MRCQTSSRRRSFLLLALAAIVCLPVAAASAKDVSESLRIPDSDVTQIVTLNDGSTLVGRIIEISDTTVKFMTEMGEFTLEISRIKEIKEVTAASFREGKYWFPNPNRTRLYLAPTGRSLRAGEGYFSSLLLFFPSVAFGITDNISISGGMSIFPGVDFEDQLFYITPKIGVNVAENVAIAGSAIIIRVSDFDDEDDDEKIVGAIYGMSTIGTDDISLTCGLGFGYVEDDIADKPAVIVGGEWRFARRASFVSENFIFPEVDEPLISYGVRFFGEKIAVDLALFNILGDDAVFPGIPLVGFVWNF
ncbi:MAG: hypothetical protein JSW34_08795 [Candidatus Zixiibacteriota bacterium]|nr:MAG: hypothetical protein JSW34_08795 [candidate division Zixibacteria bacterium]